MVLLDALDEIQEGGGSVLLRHLLKTIRDTQVPGLKFFVTSRSDPDIVSRIDAFEHKQLVQLQDIKEEEATKDITTYLEANLPGFKGTSEMKGLQEFVGGLFICAATVVHHLTMTRLLFTEQQILLQTLLFRGREQITGESDDATEALDNLYTQILSNAFDPLPKRFVTEKLSILHTFLCSVERTSTTLVAQLHSDKVPLITPSPNAADAVLSFLYAVLYVDSNKKVLSYHKSFSNFIFDKTHSKKFTCDQLSHHRLLTGHRFHIMNASLKFNIANIPSSFLMDSQNPDLQNEVQRNISPSLSYSCRGWSRHLSLTLPSTAFLEPLFGFLRLQALFWIEVMNLLNVATQCDPDLRRTSEWVEEVSGFLEFRMFLTWNP